MPGRLDAQGLAGAQLVDLPGQPQDRVLRVRKHPLQAANGVGIELSLLQSLPLVRLEPVTFKQLADFLLKLSHRDRPFVCGCDVSVIRFCRPGVPWLSRSRFATGTATYLPCA